MGKFSKYLLVSDFDRTFTDRQSQIPQANLDAIAYFMEGGGKFTLGTGRSLPMARYRFRDIPRNAPLIAFNGAVRYDLEQEQLLSCVALPEDHEALIRRFAAENPDLRLELQGLDKHYVFQRDDRRDAYLRQQHAEFVYADWADIPQPRIKFSMYTTSENVFSVAPGSPTARRFARLEADINRLGGGRYLATNSLLGMVEVQSSLCSKGLAARALARDLDRPVLVCVGDACNDRTMLEEADLPFLAADGDPRMLGQGYRLAAPCDQGTVADVIRQLEQLD